MIKQFIPEFATYAILSFRTTNSEGQPQWAVRVVAGRVLLMFSVRDVMELRGGGGDATGGLSSLSMKYYWIEVLYDRALIGATNTTLSSPSPPAEILSAYSSNHCSVLAGPSLFGQIKLLFCTPGREERGTELEIKTLFTISSPDLIYIQKQSHNMDFRLVELCKFPLIGSVFN